MEHKSPRERTDSCHQVPNRRHNSKYRMNAAGGKPRIPWARYGKSGRLPE